MSASHPRLIDIHSHFVPADFPAAPDAATAPRWPCMCHGLAGAATLNMGDKPFRQIDNRSWDLERRIADMDADGVTVQVLSPMPELLSYWLDSQATIELARHVNAAIADVVARRSDRFWGLAMVPLQDVGAAVAALPRIKADGFRGIELGSNINGRYLGEAEFEPLFAAAADLDLAIFIHALHPLQAPQLASYPDLVPFAGFITDTGLCAATLIMSGVLERHPRLRIGLSHGGGVLGPIVHRMQQGWQLTDGFGGKLAVAPNDTAARFFVDSLVYDAGYARHLASVVPGHVCLGTDYPYLIMQTAPAEFIATVATNEGDPIWSGAAERFLQISSR
jgi:aminocarboxymuconate-semialdehyde decarboxylase